MKPHPELKQPNVNVPNVLRTIELLECLPDERFAMDTFCGTACCVGGHIVAAFVKPRTSPWDTDYTSLAGEFLGLTDSQSLRLFLSHYSRSQIESKGITRADAITVLKHLARTGEVDWSVAANTDGENDG